MGLEAYRDPYRMTLLSRTSSVQSGYQDEPVVHATQYVESLRREVMEEYEEAIGRGELPIVIAVQTKSYYGDFYVLDGHHKMVS